MNSLFADFLISVSTVAVSNLLSYIKTKYTNAKDPLHNSIYGRPQIQYYNIQSEGDLNELIETNGGQKGYICNVETIFDDSGKKTIRINLKKALLKELKFDKRMSYYSIINNSQLAISVDEILTNEGRTVQMNRYSQLFIERGSHLFLLFDLNLAPKGFRLDYGNQFLTYVSSNRPQTLKIVQSENKP